MPVFILAILLNLAAVFLPTYAQSGIEACRGGRLQTGRVAEVPDGETLILDSGLAIRLAGIEVPKNPLGRRGDGPGPFAERARLILDRSVGGASVLFRDDAARDRRGRLTAAVFLADERLVQGVLIDLGLARVRIFEGAPECLAEMLARESAARAAGNGLWSSSEYSVRNANGPSLAREKGLYQVVEGRVYSVGHGSRMIFLNFGKYLRRDFTALIAPDVVARMGDAGMRIDDLEGRRVRVRGVVEMASGPVIRLVDPAQIELIGD